MCFDEQASTVNPLNMTAAFRAGGDVNCLYPVYSGYILSQFCVVETRGMFLCSTMGALEGFLCVSIVIRFCAICIQLLVSACVP